MGDFTISERNMTSSLKASVSKHVMVCPYDEDIARHARANGYATVINLETDVAMHSKGYILRKKPRLEIDCSTERFSRAHTQLLFISFKGKKERSLLADIIYNNDKPWEVRKLSKEIFASDYPKNELSPWSSITEVQNSIKDVINEDAENVFNFDESGLAKFITDNKLVQSTFTQEKPLVFDIGVTVATRFNGGFMGLTPMYEHEIITHKKLEDHMNVFECGNFAGYSGTTIPFALINMLLAVFGTELKFDGSDTPMISMFLDGRIKFCTCMSDEFDELLNFEIARWFRKDLTFNMLCKHATMFILPHEVDHTSS
jgi:hypothetical protein